ncbi:hypothetical protein RJZ57_000856 [Blastomyces gilchristii]
MAQPIITVIDPELCSQLTQETPQPRHPMFGWALTPVTDGIDLISMNMADHEVWRSRLNPGFSSRNVIQNMPTVLEEVSIFAQKLKDTADADSLEWGTLCIGKCRNYARYSLAAGSVALQRHTLESKNQKTVIDLAIKDFKERRQQPTPEFICISPDILQRLRAEHEVLGPDPKSANKVFQESPHKVNELRYTAAVIKESLRIHSLANIFRQGSARFNFSLDGMWYPTYECKIQTSPTMTHIHPELWPRPTEFIPDRFLVSEGHALYPLKNVWRPFELGNTKCIGQELAVLELKLASVLTWDVMQKRDGIGAAAETVNGERARTDLERVLVVSKTIYQ